MNTTPLALCLLEFRKTWKNFPVQHMLVFLEVARNDLEDRRWGVLDIAERLEIPQATASRIISDLGPRAIPTGSTEPVDLMETVASRSDHRKRIPVLTKRGRIFHEKLSRILEVRNANP